MFDTLMPRNRLLTGLALATVLTACSDSDPILPDEDPFQTITIDARTEWAHVRLGSPATQVQVSDPTSSTAWDLAFFASGVMVNGGAAGPGQVEGYCLCQNEGAPDANVMAMSASSELPAFLAVTAAQIPSDDDAWESDVLAPAISGWYAYDIVSHTIAAAPENVWKIRAHDGTTFARLHVTDIAGATQQHAGTITLEFSTQPAAGAAFGADQTLEVDVSGGPVYVSLVDGAISDASNWDLRFEGYTVRVNGGVSGGGLTAAIAAGELYDDITDAGDVPSQVYKSDAYGGVFAAHPWYRYNLQGDDHQIWPTFNVYLIRTGSDVYKVQLVNYYNNENGDARYITFRYEKLTD